MTDDQALDLNQTTNNTLANGFLKWVTKYHLYRLWNGPFSNPPTKAPGAVELKKNFVGHNIYFIVIMVVYLAVERLLL